METPSLQKLLDDIRAQIGAGNKIEAIKLYRDATGAGLAEAKEAIELIASGKPPNPDAGPSPPDEDAMRRVSALVLQGEKIEAIRHYRQAVGVGLKEAKDAIDALEARINPAAVVTRTAAMSRFGSLVFFGLAIVASLAVLMFVLARILLD